MKGRFTVDSGLIDFVNEGYLIESEEELIEILERLPVTYDTCEVEPKNEVDFRVDAAETLVISQRDRRGIETETPDYHLVPSKKITCYESEDPKLRFKMGFRDQVTVEFEGRCFSFRYDPR